ncbi:hypothetical protein D3C71_2233680 [compost metagenome]
MVKADIGEICTFELQGFANTLEHVERHVAQAEHLDLAVIEHRFSNNPCRIGEIDEPCVRA